MNLSNEKRRIDILALNEKKSTVSITVCPQLMEFLDQICADLGLARGDVLFASFLRMVTSYNSNRVAEFYKKHGVYTRDDIEQQVARAFQNNHLPSA